MPDLAKTHRRALPVYPSNVIHTKVLQGGSFTVPETKQVSGPSGGQGSVGVAGGVIYNITSDDPNTNEMATFPPFLLSAGDVLAVAVAANVLTVTVNSEEIFRQVGTALTVGVVNLYYG